MIQIYSLGWKILWKEKWGQSIAHIFYEIHSLDITFSFAFAYLQLHIMYSFLLQKSELLQWRNLSHLDSSWEWSKIYFIYFQFLTSLKGFDESKSYVSNLCISVARRDSIHIHKYICSIFSFYVTQFSYLTWCLFCFPTSILLECDKNLFWQELCKNHLFASCPQNIAPSLLSTYTYQKWLKGAQYFCSRP